MEQSLSWEAKRFSASQEIPRILWNPKVHYHWNELIPTRCSNCRSQWPRGLRSMSAASRLLRLWVRIPPGAWMDVCRECFVLSGGGLCDELITRPEESYRLWCVVVCDLGTSWMRRPWPNGGCCAKNKQTNKQMQQLITGLLLVV